MWELPLTGKKMRQPNKHFERKPVSFSPYRRESSTKSLIQIQLTRLSIPYGYCNVNSQQVKTQLNIDVRNTNRQYLDFELQFINTIAKYKKKIDYLDDQSEEEVLEWIVEFQELSKLASWEEETQPEILHV